MNTRLLRSLPQWTLVVGALSLSLGLASSAKAATLVLVSLECRVIEDDTEDECHLEVRSTRLRSTGVTHNYRRIMRPGNVWNVNQRLVINDTVRVTLYDEDGSGLFDPFDRDDFLGHLDVRPEPTDGTRSFTFNWDGAHYILRYRVEADPVLIRPSAPPAARVPYLPR